MTKQLFQEKQLGQTIFTTADIARLLNKNPGANLNANINYYVKTGALIAVSKGLYALNEDINYLELANKLRRPSYISFYTVLQQAGIVFQPYTTIFVAANRSEEVDISGQKIKYRRLKDEILLNPLGIEEDGNYSIATKERALLDKLYLDGEEYFDNLTAIDWALVDTLLDQVYKTKTLNKLVIKLRTDVGQN